MAAWELQWDRGHAFVEPVGAMLGPVTFYMPDGKDVSPLAVGPWGEDRGAEFDDLPPIMKRLRGEWPCVPFGAPQVPESLPTRWKGVSSDSTGADFHGFSAHNRWTLVSSEAGALTLEISYPEDHAIGSLRREIRGTPGASELGITLAITARADTSVPIALHPVFALPTVPGAAELRPHGMTGGLTFPGSVEPGVSRIASDATFDALDAVPTRDGPVDLSRLPLPFDTEELVQIFGVRGRVALRNPTDGYEAWVAFDAEVFPSVALWISNRGRTAYPWNGRFTAVGIEPLRGAFDLGPEVATNPDNPIARRGTPTALPLKAGETFTTTYHIGVRPI